jgi:hypothetical protein
MLLALFSPSLIRRWCFALLGALLATVLVVLFGITVFCAALAWSAAEPATRSFFLWACATGAGAAFLVAPIRWAWRRGEDA